MPQIRRNSEAVYEPEPVPAGDAKKSEEKDEEISNVSELPIPPDGGWGWVVVFASFMIHIIGKLPIYLLFFQMIVLYAGHFFICENQIEHGVGGDKARQ